MTAAPPEQAVHPARIERIVLENFKCFAHLEINRLGQVNLIVGENGSGKTTVLEALHWYAAQNECWGPLAIRREMASHEGSVQRIGGVPPATLKVFYPGWNGEIHIVAGRNPKNLPSVFFEAKGMTADEIKQRWWDVELTEKADLVTQSMRLVDPRIESVRVRPESNVMEVRKEGKRVTLRSLGDGVVRAFSLALALVASQGGLLLIDEFENGLYYKVQNTIWEFVMRNALALDVTVFATTHSLDCLYAFGRAAEQVPEISAVVNRLEEVKGRMMAIPYEARDVRIAEESGIELR